MDISEPNPTPDGLQTIRAMMASGKRPAMDETMGFTLVEANAGHVVFEARPGRQFYNPLNIVHGGYAAAMLDSACGCAVRTKLSAGQNLVTLELKISYHKAITAETGPVRATGRVLSIGRRIAFSEARLTDEAGKLYASATSTIMVITAD
jgi:uncharacterized protein (TIGR00369 family)